MYRKALELSWPAACITQPRVTPPFLRSRTALGSGALLVAAWSFACTSSTTSTIAPSGDKCQFALSNAPSSFGPAGGSGIVKISTARDCLWTLAVDAPWITASGDLEGQGEAAVAYSVQANPVPVARSGALVVGDERVQLSQGPAVCKFELSSPSASVAAVGGTVSVNIATLAGCGWTAAPQDAWLTIASGQSGNTNTTVAIRAAANTGSARIGRVLIGGQTFTVSQAAASGPGTPGPPPPPDPEPPAPPSPGAGIVQLSGSVSSRKGHCPALSFRVSGRDVLTTLLTGFEKGKCTDVSNGDEVVVDGLALTSTGVVTATHVEITKNKK